MERKSLKFVPKLAIIIVIVCSIALGVTYLIKTLSGLSSQKIEFSSNPESIMPPFEEQVKTKEQNYNNYFYNVSKEPYTVILNFIFSWQNLLDIFAANPQIGFLRYNISQNTLESLNKNIKKTQHEFFKGSSDEIISQYGKVIKDEANYYKLDWRLILSMIKQESAFTSNAVSRAGAYGFMQIMPKTGQTLEQTLNLEDHTSPVNNLVAGIYYYALLVGRYDQAGDPEKYKFALAAYNAGSGHVEDAMSIAYYNGKDYLKWENVEEAMTMLSSNYDTLHTKIWNGRPPNGVFNNWKEPVNYVSNIIYYWGEYQRIYPEPTEKKLKKKKKR